MFKHLVLLVVATILVVIFRDPIVHALNFLLLIHHRLASSLSLLFSGDSVGRIAQNVLAILIIPCAVGGVFALVYYIIKKSHYAHTMMTIWVVWLVLASTLLAQTVSVIAK